MARETGRVRPGTAATKGEVNQPVTTSLPAQLDYVSIAVLEIDDAWVSPTMAVAREVAVAFAAGRPTRSWLVQLDDVGTSPIAATTSSSSVSDQCGSAGLGLPPTVVARELVAAVNGYRVLTSDPPRVHRWLRQLFAHSDKPGLPFEVDDLYCYFEDLRFLPTEQRDAIAAASRMVRGGERAATEAARNAIYTAALTIRVQARLNETTPDREPDPGVVGS